MAAEAQFQTKQKESPFSERVLLDFATSKTNENIGEALKILSAAAKSFESSGVKESEITKIIADLKKNPVDIKVTFGVQYA